MRSESSVRARSNTDFDIHKPVGSKDFKVLLWEFEFAGLNHFAEARTALRWKDLHRELIRFEAFQALGGQLTESRCAQYSNF
jgi:hypothetical protein